MALAALVAASAAACGDDYVPGPRPAVPPTPLDSRVAELVASRVEAIVNQQVLRAMLTADDRVASSLSATAAAQRLGIPVGARGRVYLYDEQQDRWVADPTRTDALANGVRFMLGPRVGATNAPVVGFVDVADVVVDGVPQLTATITAATTHIAMTYEQRSPDVPVEPGYADAVSGQVRGTGGAGTLAFFSYESVEPTAIPDQDIERWHADWAHAGQLSVETGGIIRHAPGDSNYTVMRLDGRTLRFVNRHVPDPENPRFYTMNDTTRVSLDEQRYALIVHPAAVDPNGPPKFLRSNGTPLPAEEQSTLTRLETSTASVVQVLLLPLVVRLWLADLSYPGGP